MQTSQIKPLSNRILIKRLQEEVKRGGILLPETSMEKSKKGEVIAVGPGKTDEEGVIAPIGIVQGDIVLFSQYSGTPVKVSDSEEELLLLTEEEILAVFV